VGGNDTNPDDNIPGVNSEDHDLLMEGENDANPNDGIPRTNSETQA